MALLEENDILFAHKALNLVAGLSDAAKRVAATIIDHFNRRTGQCDPGIERIGTMLGIDRATVIRATEKLHECGLIEKVSHGGYGHRACYRPNWDRFRAIVGEWEAAMKSGARASLRADAEPANVAGLRPSTSQRCDLKRRKIATQTNRINHVKEPIEAEQVETQGSEPRSLPSERPPDLLWTGSKPTGQRSFLLPIRGGRGASHQMAAESAAERRWTKAASDLGDKAFAQVVEWMTPERQAAATQAELVRRGGGLAFVLDAMNQDIPMAYASNRPGG